MKNKSLQCKKVISISLLFLLLCVVGLTKLQAQNIVFADNNVKAICVANWDTSGDNELSYAETAAVTDLENAFYDNHTITSFNELQYFTGLTHISFLDFHNSSVTSLVIPESVTSINNQAFYGCDQLTSVNLPSGITVIGWGMFQYCRSLVSITIPAEVTYIDAEAFQDCIGLTSITLLAAEPVSINEQAFENVNRNIPVYVPCGSLSAYQNAEGWSEFTNFFESCSGDAPVGAINGLFSVGENTQVYFSQGNLQYQASTNTWRFAEDQWDYVGDANSNISETYDGWIDLFGWGTSGWNSGNTYYHPWDSDTPDDGFVYGPSGEYDLTSDYVNADWGVYNAISNGGNQAGLWRTLTQPEWDYVFNTRNTTSGIRFAMACLNNINGVILLPDTWNAETYSLNNTNNSVASYANNTLTGEQWSVLEQAGAVFLPAAGYRSGTSVNVTGSNGYYWSASHHYLCNAYRLHFYDGSLYTDDYYYVCRCDGSSVRLVRSTEIYSFEIQGTPNPAEGGTIIGAGTFQENATCTLTATANDGYTFVNWTESGQVVSTDATYSFTVTGDRNLVANFYDTSNCPLLYSFSDDDHTATVIGHCEGQSATGELVIPETIVHNGESYTVTAIGDDALRDCIGLTSISFGNTLTSIGERAFWHCEGLTSVVLPNSLVSIASEAFRYCYSLTEINIPSSVTSIGLHVLTGEDPYEGSKNPFSTCWNLASITVDPENSYYDSRNNCNAIIETATNKLVSASSSTIIPNTVTEIGWDAFSEIQIPSITIPASVNYIGNFAFSTINTLSSITVLSANPPDLGWGTFDNINRDIPVNIPCGSLSAYQNAEGWNEFTNFIEMCDLFSINAVSSPTAGGTITGAGNYEPNATCTLTATANEGYIFVNWTKDGAVVSTSATYSFTVTESASLVANFAEQGSITNHWSPVQTFENTMDGIGVVLVDGVEQQSAYLELGIFCGEECRGSVLPEEENGQWLYYFSMGGVEDETFTFRLYDHVLQQELELVCGNEVPFEINGFLGDWNEPYEIRFYNNIPISVTVNPEGAGTVTGAGDYPYGSNVTLSATANTGFAFKEWSINGQAVSTETTLTITIESPLEVTANFDYMQEYTFSTGWNWWSTYIELSDINGLEMLEAGLGESGVMIKTNGAYARKKSDNTWFGSLRSINNETGYKVQTSSACALAMTGALSTPTDHTITISANGWTWIGYPIQSSQGANAALSAFEPENKDIIKGQNGYARYDANTNTWKPTSFTLIPGKSYLYYSNANEAKSLVWTESRSPVAIPEQTECSWKSDIYAYPDNSTVQAVVLVDGNELQSDAYELGAFVDGICRGSAILSYDAYYDRYFAMMTITGEDDDNITFRLIDKEKSEVITDCETTMRFVSDGIVGDFDSPYEVRFTTKANNTALLIYPNPVERNTPYTFDLPMDETVEEIVVFNTLGDIVSREAGARVGRSILGITTTGIYTVKITCRSGNTYTGRIVVR